MLPSQRQRILLPLTVTHYTCLLDVEINVRGGGTTGQCEACVPAIANAIQAYDVNARAVLKYLRLLRNDPRRVERKKPGLLKARKGQTYVRRWAGALNYFIAVFKICKKKYSQQLLWIWLLIKVFIHDRYWFTI